MRFFTIGMMALTVPFAELRADDLLLVQDGRPRAEIVVADEFAALQGIARILTRKGQFDQALAILNRANPDKLQGTWRARILQSIEQVQQARNERRIRR